MKKCLKVLIVGGGIGGMCAAIELKKLDADVTLIDLDPNWRVYGTGITVTGPTYRALREIGLMEEVAAAGATCRGARTRTAGGMLLSEVVEHGLEPGLPYGGGILRPRLHKILSDRVKQDNIRIKLGVTIDTLEDSGHDVFVEMSDGTSDRYDLVIGADGVNSRTRTLVLPEAPEPRFTGQGAWRMLVPRPADLDMIDMYLGQPVKAGVTPVSDDECYTFVLTPESEGELIPDDEQPDRLRDALAGFGGLIGEIRDSIDADSPIVYRPLNVLFVDQPWYRGRTVLIGDAVHATTPHLASGAGCAIEDAVILAQELKSADDVEGAFRSFYERRYDRCRDVIQSSVRLGKMELAGEPGEEQGRVYAEAMARLGAPA